MSDCPKLPAALVELAAAPYRSVGLHPWLFARGKLRGDPVFAGLLRRGLIPSQSRLLDLGCGQGLLGALLYAASAQCTNWPQGWAAPPQDVVVRGIDSAAREVRWAEHMASACGGDDSCGGSARMKFDKGDICKVEFGRHDTVVLLDVLHYLPFDTQLQLLTRVRDCLMPGGRLLLRVADASAGLGFSASLLVDKLVLAARGECRLGLSCRPLAEWQQLLQTLGFALQTLPMHAGTPFANSMLVGQTTPIAPASKPHIPQP